MYTVYRQEQFFLNGILKVIPGVQVGNNQSFVDACGQALLSH